MKKSSKKGLKIAAITVGCIALAVAAGFGTYRIKNRIDSKKYNLITLDTSSLPAPQEPVRDDFVQLKNVRMHYVVYGSGRAAPCLNPRKRRQREVARRGGKLSRQRLHSLCN